MHHECDKVADKAETEIDQEIEDDRQLAKAGKK